MGEVTGANELRAALTDLGNRGVVKVAQSIQGARTTAIARAVRAAAPRGQTGMTRASIGRKLNTNRKALTISSKVGINVGSAKSRAASMANRLHEPHAHLVALGTKPRWRKVIGGKFASIRRPTDRQLSTGTMPSHPFVLAAFNAALPAADAAGVAAGQRRLAREMAKRKH